MEPSDEASGFDPEAVRAKYEAERDKRMVKGAGGDPRPGARRGRSPSTARIRSRRYADRDPVDEDVEVAIIGAGIAGVVAGAQLRKHGIDSIRMIDQAGGIGGTWYWNRYPGVMCDVESYIYMPMLEEMDYVPTKRYALRRGDPRAPRGDRASGSTSSTRALFHTGVQHDRVGRRAARAGCSAPIAATRSAPGT